VDTEPLGQRNVTVGRHGRASTSFSVPVMVKLPLIRRYAPVPEPRTTGC
jgi:hypothetical protein